MESQNATSGTEETPKRHCWECLRRCLVCDSTRPACNRCSTSLIQCPGYSEIKPSRLRWLAPGRVTSRSRKLKGASPTNPGNEQDETGANSTTELALGTDYMSTPHFKMRTVTCALAQAAEYYNTCIYPDVFHANDLGPNPYIHFISPVRFQAGTKFPDYLQLSFVCMTLSHRINRTRDYNTPSNTLIENFYKYRGMVIRSLSSDLNVEHKRTSDTLIAGIISLFLLDVQQGASPNWRWHLEGIQKLITLRGGIRALVGSKTPDALLLCIASMAVIGDTTSPASNLAMTSSHVDELDFLVEQFGSATFSFQLCPPLLFTEIIKINHLRMRAAKGQLSEANDLFQEGYGILSRIHGFSPEQWAESKPLSKGDWMLIGYIYQSTVALYCISSLQSVSILPLDSHLRTRCAAHGRLLQALLNEAVPSPKVNRIMLWPLVVLGMEAVNGGAAMRNFVRKQLPELSREIGTYMPLIAKRVLERFWASGEARWDACFDRPYVFAAQIAVDISGV
ncbi:C6 zinc finger domain-containing protein [Xylogone sp. PMI_703]|nr:C6 zinc finger domain-containing protein [Xylogone sp. PMI_703]